MELIDTLWNVNEEWGRRMASELRELIDTLWNVNRYLYVCQGGRERGINRYIMECKYIFAGINESNKMN